MQVERESTFGCEYSGERVSNTWATCLRDWDNVPKGTLIPDDARPAKWVAPNGSFGFYSGMGPRRISLLVR
jgi:hypothetical protein